LAQDPPRPPSNWRDLRLRALSAAVLIPIALGALWAGGMVWLALMILGVAGLATEWTMMARRRPGPGIVAISVLVFLYFAAGGIALVHLRGESANGFANVLFLLLLVWSTDIGAYVAGRAIGGPKLAPAISPGKTWSGAVGGLACALVVALIAGATPGGFVLAACLSITSQIGDLAKSVAKRYFGVKDSSHLIPGHGGLLDRLDGLLAAAPLAALFEFARGGGLALWR
jgi:phosphatidate cytidylyltransferase